MRYLSKIPIFISLLLLTNPVQAESNAGSYFRIRGHQASSLMTSSTEKGVFQRGDTKVEMSTHPGRAQGWMLSYGVLGVGAYSVETTFDSAGSKYTLESDIQDLGLIFNGPGNTSFTFGQGVVSGGKGVIANSNASLETEEVSGSSLFAHFALEYALPLNLAFIGLDFTEFILGYRENSLTYKGFSGGSSIISKSLKIKSIQYQFGIGFVF